MIPKGLTKSNMWQYQQIYTSNKNLTLTYDVVSVNGTALLITSARKNKFVTVKHIPSRTEYQLGKILNKTIKLYG